MSAATSTVAPVARSERALSELTLEALFRAHVDDVYRVLARLLGPGATGSRHEHRGQGEREEPHR